MPLDLIPTTSRRATALAAVLSVSALWSCDDPMQRSLLAPDLAARYGLAAFNTPPATIGWQEQARALVGLNRLSVLSAERVYAYLSVAQYGAIDNADQHGFPDDDGPANGLGTGGRARFELERGAVTGASSVLLSFFFPNQQALLEQRAREEAEARGTTHPAFKRGLAIGAQMAQTMIQRAQLDRFTAPFTGAVPTGPGKWLASGTPLGATGGNVLPLVLSSGDQFRAPPPPAFGSAAFLADLAEIKAISDTRTADQLAIARAWAYPGGTFTPAGHWNQLAGTYVAEYGLNERAATHVFALMHAAQFDAHVIGCFDSKYEYWYIRPSQAEPSITLPIGLPNHPSYPSGHSCASSAATTVLAYFFPEKAAELEQVRTEAGLSRMYGGIHYRFDITAAVQLGRSVAQYAIGVDRNEGLLSGLQ